MSWLLGLLGWGGAAAVAVALLLGLTIGRNVLLIAGVAVMLAIGAWGLRGYAQADSARNELSTLKIEVANDKSIRAAAALAQERAVAEQEANQAKATQENSDAFTQTQSARDAAVRADLAAAQRLRVDAERRAATYRAMSTACAASSSDIADRLVTLDRQLVDGVGVVADLRAVVDRRDAEVKLLRLQVDIDRAEPVKAD